MVNDICQAFSFNRVENPKDALNTSANEKGLDVG